MWKCKESRIPLLGKQKPVNREIRAEVLLSHWLMLSASACCSWSKVGIIILKKLRERERESERERDVVRSQRQ
jgi:hypothetical protein